MNFLIHSLNRFVLKKEYLRVASFLQSGALYANIPFKLDWEENIFDFCAELIAFRIEIFINLI